MGSGSCSPKPQLQFHSFRRSDYKTILNLDPISAILYSIRSQDEIVFLWGIKLMID
jgi:hypothetical protein